MKDTPNENIFTLLFGKCKSYDKKTVRKVFRDYFLVGLLGRISFSEKCPYLEFFWSVFSAFGLNTEGYGVSECGHFSRFVNVSCYFRKPLN